MIQSNISNLQFIHLLDTENSNTILFDSLWTDLNENELIYIVLFRRFGCVCAKTTGLNLTATITNIKKDFADKEMKVVGIGLDDADLEVFKAQNFFPFPIFLDSKKQIYKQLNFKKNTLFNCFGLCNDKAITKYKAMQKKYNDKSLENTFKSDWGQMGGSLIVNKNGGVVFEYSDKYLGDHPTEEDIKSALSNVWKKY